MNKYRNKKVFCDGMTFDSKKELARYLELKILERAGEVRGIECQKKFELITSVKINGKTKPAIRYFSDFSYFIVKDGEFIVEDVKSAMTRKLAPYRMKIHMMKYLHGIEIKEI